MSDHADLIPPGMLPLSERDAAVRRNATGDPGRCAADQQDRLRARLRAAGAPTGLDALTGPQTLVYACCLSYIGPPCAHLVRR